MSALAERHAQRARRQPEPGQGRRRRCARSRQTKVAGPIATQWSSSFAAAISETPIARCSNGRGWMNEHGRREPCRPSISSALRRSWRERSIPPSRVRRRSNACCPRCPASRTSGRWRSNPSSTCRCGASCPSSSPDWMLPGAGDLIDGDVVGLSTNPAFVESLLVGANHQATAELRWRNVPLVDALVAAAQVLAAEGEGRRHRADQDLADAAALGSTALVPPGRTAEAVVAFRTSLFRRYPATVVYLYPAAARTGTAPEPDGRPAPPTRAADVHRDDRHGHHVLRLPGATGGAAHALGGARGTAGRLSLLSPARCRPPCRESPQRQLVELRVPALRACRCVC